MGQIMLQTFRRVTMGITAFLLTATCAANPASSAITLEGLQPTCRTVGNHKNAAARRPQTIAGIHCQILQNADTLGIELVIDYAQSRSWRCDRGTWQIGKFPSGDWYHIEVAPRLANDPEATKQAFQAVFRPSPQAAPKPV
jgi:hypothetical protein